MMPKHSFRAPWARRLTALLAVSLFTVSACSDDGGGVAGGSNVTLVEIVTLPNLQTLTNLTPGNTRQMLGVPTNSAGNWVNKPVTWASTNNAAATVSAEGLVTAVAGGSTYIKATAGGRTDSILVAVRYPVGTIVLTPAVGSPLLTIRREGGITLGVTTLDTQGDPVTGRTVTFSSSNTATATVNATSGAVIGTLAVDGSTTVITATAANALDGGSIVTETRTVTIMGDPAVSSVTITGFAANGFYGTTATNITPVATARSAAGTVIGSAVFDWSSSDAAVATANATTGEVDFLTAGTTEVSASTEAFPGGPDVTGTFALEVATAIGAVATPVPSIPVNTTHSFAYLADSGTTFTVTTSAGTGGDADMAVFPAGVTTWSYFVSGFTTNGGSSVSANRVCTSGSSGNVESCVVDPTATGWYRVVILAWGMNNPAVFVFLDPVVGVEITATP